MFDSHDLLVSHNTLTQKTESMKTETKLRTVRMRTDIVERMDELAKKDNRSFNNYLETLCIREIQRLNK